jgi:hypothetical protein
LLANKDFVIPAEATWPSEHGAKRAWGTNILKQPGGNDQRKSVHLTPTEIVVKRATWKSLLDNMYIDGATRDVKGEDEAYKFASQNALGGLLVFTHFFDKEKEEFTKDPCLMVIALPLTRPDGPALTITSPQLHTRDLIKWIQLATTLRPMVPVMVLEQTRPWMATS